MRGKKTPKTVIHGGGGGRRRDDEEQKLFANRRVMSRLTRTKWERGGIINKSRQLHRCALSVISLPRVDESHPAPPRHTHTNTLQAKNHTPRAPSSVTDGILKAPSHTHTNTHKPRSSVTFLNKSAYRCSECRCDRYLWMRNASHPYLKPEMPFHFLTARRRLFFCPYVSSHLTD